MYSGCASFLRETDDGGRNPPGERLAFGAETGRHGEVGELVDDHHKIWQILVPVCREKLAVLVFLVVVLELVHSGKAEQGVALVHLDTERIKHIGRIPCFLYDGVLRLLFLRGRRRQDGEIVLEKPLVGRELDHLRVDEHEFQFRRMLGIEQRGDYHVESHGLSLLRGSGDQKMRSLSEVEDLDIPRDGAADCDRKLRLGFAEGIVVEHRLERHYGRLAVRNLDSDGIVKFHDAHALRPEGDSDVVLHGPD